MSSNLFNLEGKTALITGGNGGIGLGIAKGFAVSGADIAIAGRNENKTVEAHTCFVFHVLLCFGGGGGTV